MNALAESFVAEPPGMEEPSATQSRRLTAGRELTGIDSSQASPNGAEAGDAAESIRGEGQHALSKSAKNELVSPR